MTIAKNSKLYKIIRFFKKYGWCYAFIAVPILVFAAFKLYPLISAFVISFQHYRPIGSEWVGLDNYKSMFNSSIFFKSLLNTLIYTVGTVPINIMIALFISLLMFPLNKKLQTFFKASYYLPVVASGVTISLVWLWIFDPMPEGLLNQFIGLFGAKNINWLGSSNTALFSLMLMTYLGGHGSAIIIYLAALGGIPKDLYEAAEIDGANKWAKVTKITLPLLKPTTLFLLVTGVIGSFQVFMNAYLMTYGGPDYATTLIGFLIFKNAFDFFDFGLASAEGLFLAVIIATLSYIQMKFFGSDVEY